MRRILTFNFQFSIFILAILISPSVSAQFYGSGRPSGLRSWQTMSDDTTKVIFSKGSEAVAAQLIGYMQSERGRLNTGYKFSPLEMPIVLWSGTALSNGLAMQAPRRIEFVAMPSVNSYSEPWLWQLAVHEGRHSVQYGNINQNTVKALSYIFGEQVEMLASGLVPFWMLEGDAVLHETLSSESGRGEQPSFSMHYRALGDDILKGGNVDKWFSGSYNDFVPDHYELGYQLVKYLYDETGKVVANDVADYTSKYPFLIFTTQLALKKHYGLYTPELFRRTFASFITEQNQADIPDTDSAKPITAYPQSYTTYQYPQFLDDSTIIALKTDFDDPQRFVAIDIETGRERLISHTGMVSTRPDLRDGKLLWTEYRRSMIWDGEYSSKVVTMDTNGSRMVTFDRDRSALFPVFASKDQVAWLEYNSESGGYSLIYGDKEKALCGVEKSYHGLGWDDKECVFYTIALTEEGMYIEKYDPATDSLIAITEPVKHTLSDLRVGEDGILYFGSVENGIDEVYAIDPSDGSKYRLTTSRFGAFNPSNERNGYIALTTYSKMGYGVALQNTDEGVIEIQNSKFKIQNDTDIDNDTINHSPLTTNHYSKLSHLFHFHSWMPLNVDYEGIMAGAVSYPTIGATLLSQNLLGTSTTQLNYGYDIYSNKQSVRGSWLYEGFAPKIELAATWSNVQQSVVSGGAATPVAPVPTNYSLTLSAFTYLPLVLSDGYNRRTLTPSIQYSFNNTKSYFPDKYRYNTIVAFQLGYSNYTTMAKRDLYPKWGYNFRSGYITDNPFASTIDVLLLYGQLYVPGILDNHSFSLAAAYQSANINENVGMGYLYMAQNLIPRGVGYVYPTEFSAVSANYALPVVYPDWGVQGVLFLQRIWARLGVDYASWQDSRREQQSAISAGGTINFDITPFRMPDNATTTLSLSIFFPSTSRTPYWGVGFSAPI